MSRLGLEPRNLAVPDFKSVLQFAVRGFTKTQLYKSVRCVYQFRQRLIFRTLKSFADLRHTLYNLHLYSISRETRSEHWGATPTLPAPVPKNQVLRRIGIPTTFTRHSELFDNFCYYPNTLNSNFFLLVIAIGLLVPRPYLIARLLGHQRRLSSWCTMVWNSHQLIPNMAYSPQGRLLRER